ncbi:YeiH family protein [Phyllobacterium sp. YR531]|uniref:YeiH family protein n=1 Tax=Phyllobacterium sp. YR531 TaxID=1144343 RepID=UPI00026FAA3A|nr:YeiH family protein [Phyllobacterium sp. YR531]EJM99313.1 putative membrane protein [Phyllobacterium sp. YR531]
MFIHQRAFSVLPGLALCCAVAFVAVIGEHIETAVFGVRWVESLVLVIVVGIAIRSLRQPDRSLAPGIDFSAKFLLEMAIVLLGASISLTAMKGAGLTLIAGIAGVVALSITISYGIGRLFGLPPKLATLIACGNSICGNSAIVAVAPVIEADRKEIAAALTFTAVLGIVAVFLLPLLYFHTMISVPQYGVLAGLTVYAVPQVIAATAPAGLLGMQTGTLVKLVRVLMLGPVLIVLGAIMKADLRHETPAVRREISLVPWFIGGFAAMMILRSLGLIPEAAIAPMAQVSNVLTIIAMAALGLSVDIRSVAHAGGRVMAAAILSLASLVAISFGLIALLQLA